RVLEAAYNDKYGVTAAFNLNLLRRMNRELGANFDPAGFGHLAYFDPEESRVEMHLYSLRNQAVSFGEKYFQFRRGETIQTENSYKYTFDVFRALARAAGF